MNGGLGRRDVRLPLDAADRERGVLQARRRARAPRLRRAARCRRCAACRPDRSRGPARRACPSTVTSRAANDSGVERRRRCPTTAPATNARRSRSRSTTSRVATDCTRPAERPRHDLLPEHGRDLVAVEPVEDAPRLLRVDEPLVDLARLAERAVDRVARDLVEHHALDRHLRLQHLRADARRSPRPRGLRPSRARARRTTARSFFSSLTFFRLSGSTM